MILVNSFNYVKDFKDLGKYFPNKNYFYYSGVLGFIS